MDEASAYTTDGESGSDEDDGEDEEIVSS